MFWPQELPPKATSTVVASFLEAARPPYQEDRGYQDCASIPYESFPNPSYACKAFAKAHACIVVAEGCACAPHANCKLTL